MASNSSATEKEKRQALPFDVWYLVFENMEPRYDEDPFPRGHFSEARRAWLLSTRLVSKVFNVIATRHAFKDVDLSKDTLLERLMNAPMDQAWKFLRNVQQYAREMKISSDSNKAHVNLIADLLATSRYVERLRWVAGPDDPWEKKSNATMASKYFLAYVNAPGSPSSFFYGSDKRGGSLIRADRETMRKILRRAPINPTDHDDPGARSQQVSIIDRDGGYCPSPSADSQSKVIKALSLFQCSYVQGPIPVGRKCPPMLKLSLDHYSWKLPAKDFSLIWDFSMMQNLCLKDSHISRFLRRVPIADLARLRSLKIVRLNTDIFNGHRVYPSTCHPAVEGLLRACPGIESLKVDYSPAWSEAVSFDEVSNIGSGLRKLRLRNLDKPVQISTATLQIGLHKFNNIRHLGLDMDTTSHEFPDFLLIIARAKSLQHLELFAMTTLRTSQVEKASTDPEYDNAERIMRSLHDQKIGDSFTSITINLERPRRPRKWRPQPDEEGYSKSEYTGYGIRSFMSRMSFAGVYVQTGSHRIGGIRESISGPARKRARLS
ncbi:hypothetical protein VTL71DRAFT_13728 [Oculimacula yallundae]|uniref:F-box domain-containing protein n=1 Tax=Oculimacula yallundae TaxID=86028 RepID=A0ABR4CL78_9HELO